MNFVATFPDSLTEASLSSVTSISPGKEQVISPKSVPEVEISKESIPETEIRKESIPETQLSEMTINELEDERAKLNKHQTINIDKIEFLKKNINKAQTQTSKRRHVKWLIN